jgi:hypothetical protein
MSIENMLPDILVLIIVSASLSLQPYFPLWKRGIKGGFENWA